MIDTVETSTLTISPSCENDVGRGDAVAHLLIDGGADALWKALVMERGGNRAPAYRLFIHPLIDLFCGNTGANPSCDKV